MVAYICMYMYVTPAMWQKIMSGNDMINSKHLSSLLVATVTGSDAFKCYECLNCPTPTRPMDCPANVTTCFKADYNGLGKRNAAN